MSNNHPIADGVLDLAGIAISKGENWMAYNNCAYFLDKDDVCFFKTKDEAVEFAIDNFSDRDQFRIIHFLSLDDILRQIPYEGISNTVGLLQSAELIRPETLINSQQNISFMNKENFDFLADNIKYAGFGESLKADLEKAMKEGKPEFQLLFSTEFSKKPFEATLNFRKSDSSDMYFFNNYRASLERNNGEKYEQTFYLNKGKGITAKEAFNLLDGRAVQKDQVTKEGQPYKAWIQLDVDAKDKHNNFEIKQYHEKYGFDLKEAVGKFPVAELKDPEQAKKLMESLQKGNVQSVTLEKDRSAHKMFIEADPKFKSVKMYDAQMKLVTKESLFSYQSIGKETASKTAKENMVPDKKKEVNQGAKMEKEKPEKKKGNSLLPKKRESAKKGLGVS